jgi:hypothetical protein
MGTWWEGLARIVVGGLEALDANGSLALTHMLVQSNDRFERMVRVTILIGLIQWAQQFHCHFPRWYNSLNRSWRALLVKSWLIVLTPPSAYRLIEWFLWPGEGSRLIGLLQHHLSGTLSAPVLVSRLNHRHLDNMLVSMWSLLCLVASHYLLHLDGQDLKSVGWRKSNFTEPTLWCRQTMRFKLTLVFPMFALFVRGVLSTHQGFSFAQKDTVREREGEIE